MEKNIMKENENRTEEPMKLDEDEGIILESEDAYWFSDDVTALKYLILTNKKIYCVYEKSNGIFKGMTERTASFQLSDIKIIGGQPMVHQTDHAGYDCLRIQFKQSIEYFSFYSSARKKTSLWANDISKAMGIPVEEDIAGRKANIWQKTLTSEIRFCPFCGRRIMFVNAHRC